MSMERLMSRRSDSPLPFLLLFFAIFALSNAAISTATVENKSTNKPPVPKRVLLIGIDGLTPAALKQAVSKSRHEKKNPNFVRLFDKGVVDYHLFAGGVKGTSTQQETKRAPGWATILTGVWKNRHHVGNQDQFMRKNNKFLPPTLFNHIHKMYPKSYMAMATSWFQLGNLCKQGPSKKDTKNPVDRAHTKTSDNQVTYILNDGELAEITLNELVGNPKLVLMYFGSVAAVGRESGYGQSSYTLAVDKVVKEVERLAQKVDAQRNATGDRWLIVLTSSHGGHDKTTGTQEESDRRVFVLLMDPSDPRYNKGAEVRTDRGIDAITPTILEYFMGPNFKRENPRDFKYLGEPLKIPISSSAAPTITSAVALVTSTLLYRILC